MRRQRVIPAMLGVLFAGVGALAGTPGCGNEGGSSFDEGAEPAKPAGGPIGGTTGPSAPTGGADPQIGNATAGSGTPADDFDAGCATAEAVARASPVYMLIVLDASTSMRDDNKWTAANTAIGRFFDDVHTKKDTNLGVGLMLFQGTESEKFPRNGDVMDTRVVDDGQWTKLKARIGQGSPLGNTPTLNALTAAYAAMGAFKTTPTSASDTGFADQWAKTYGPLEPGGRKVVILASDGIPSPQTSQPAIETSVGENLKTQGILTFAIGIGPFPGKSGYDPAFMGRVAQAGGTAVPNCIADTRVLGEVCHFQITPGGSAATIADQLLTAINAIRKVATGCEYSLSVKAGTTVDPSRVNVVVRDGNGKDTTIDRDPQNGWVYDNDPSPTKVLLKGNACESVKKDEKASVRIVLGCTGPIPK